MLFFLTWLMCVLYLVVLVVRATKQLNIPYFKFLKMICNVINKINNKITNKPTYLCELHFKADDVIRTYSFWNNFNDVEMVRN